MLFVQGNKREYLRSEVHTSSRDGDAPPVEVSANTGEVEGEGLDDARDGDADTKAGFEEVVVLFPPCEVVALDIVHENEGQVDTIRGVAEVVPARPVEGTGPADYTLVLVQRNGEGW